MIYQKKKKNKNWVPIQKAFKTTCSFSHIYGLIQVAGISYMSNDTLMLFENLAYWDQILIWGAQKVWILKAL